MQSYNQISDLFSSKNFKYLEINKEIAAPKSNNNNNFLNCIENAKTIINSLDRSLNKTRNYEDQLLICKSKHIHTHNKELSCENRSKCSDAEISKTSRNPVDIADSWSTMSIVRLQYQYEELSKRYESLLQAYDERNNVLNNRNAALCRLRERIKRNQDQLIDAHKSLLAVGEKYLMLRRKKYNEKQWYLDRIEHLKKRIQDVVVTAERARLELDDQIMYMSSLEHDDGTKLLLKEIRACNLLFLENIQLKSMVELVEK